jgi:hypothetical protein
MKIQTTTKLIKQGFTLVNMNPDRLEFRHQKTLIVVDDTGYDYISATDPEHERNIQTLMQKLKIPRIDHHLQDTIKNIQEKEIPEKLLAAGYEFVEDNNEYCKDFKTHSVCMNIQGMVSFYVDEDDYDHFMMDQEERVKRWESRFRKIGVEMKGVEGVYKQ